MIRLADEVPATHPALAGHFPGRPIVPGVLLLARVARAAAAAYGGEVSAVASAKFLAPLAPGERFELELEGDGPKVKFRVLRGAALVAAGALRLG